MPRGYRGIILAAFAGLTAAASPAQHPNPNRGHPEDASAKAISDAGERISAAITNASKPPEGEGRCGKRSYEDDADLCAQWEAADAARDAANYAWYSIVLGAFGTALLVWTLWDTRLTAIREQRAYVRVDSDKGGKVVPDEPIVIPLAITNYGKTPAKDLVVTSSVVVRPPDWDWSHDEAVDLTKGQKLPRLVLHPGAPQFAVAELEESLPAAVHSSILAGTAVVFIKGRVAYRDVFRRRRETTFQLEFHGKDKNKVRISPHGNDAT